MENKKNSSIPLIIALIIFGVTGWYGFSKYTALSVLNTQLAEADTTLFGLEQENADLMGDYQDAKKDFMDDVSANQEKIDAVFPSDEDITGLTRAFDDFAFENHYANNPFFINQLAYDDIEVLETYRILPISMSLETSQSNFEKFLEYVDTSGSLDNGVRLMSIDSISLQLVEDELRVQLSLNAYLQNV